MEKNKSKKQKDSSKAYRGHLSYVSYLGKYVGVFEDSINKQLTAEVELKKKYPNSACYFRNNIKRLVGHSTSEKLEKTLKGRKITLAYNGSNCLMYELCRHIRNSYCHMLLEIDGDKLKIVDKSRGKLTSSGYLLKDILVDFIKMIVNEYENSFKQK